MTYAQFYDEVESVLTKFQASEFKDKSLEEYLLSLLNLAKKHADKALSAPLLFEILSGAFSGEAAKFDDKWRNLTAPDDKIWASKFTNSGFKEAFKTQKFTLQNGFDHALNVIKFQIAELVKMRESGDLQNEARYLGITSPSGNDWYNFDPFSLLECGARGLLDNAQSEDDEIEFGWELLGELLETGRVYE